MERRDTQTIKERLPLADVVEADLGPPAKQSGDKLFWRCPFHDETNPSFVVFSDGGFKCFGCGLAGDLFTYLMRRDGVTFPQAKQRAAALVGLDPSGSTPAAPKRRRPPVHVADPPPHEWQQAAGAAMLDCAFDLGRDGSAKARAWLNERGLKDETLADWFVGFNDAGRTRHGLYVPRGVTLPHYQRGTGDVWAIKVRRSSGEPKYVNVKGGRPHLWGIDNLSGGEAAFLCEGEFDGLLLRQEAGDLVGVVAQGGASQGDVDTWLPYLLPVERLYIATDADAAGERAAAYWLAQTRRARRVLPPLGQNDLTDAWLAGADLRTWVLENLKGKQ